MPFKFNPFTGTFDNVLATSTLAPSDASYVVLGASASLTNERILTGTTNQVNITDNGAGSTVVLSLPQNIHTGASPTFTGLTLSAFSTGVVHSNSSGVLSSSNIVNADVDAAAAIARSKLASGTADHVLINDGSGVMSSEAQLAVSRGGTNIGSYTAGDILYATGATTLAKLPVGASATVLTSSGSAPQWQTLSAAGIAASTEAFVTIGNTAGLSAERALTGTANQITITDNGANSTVVLSTPQNIHTGATPTFASLTLSGLTAGRVIFAGLAGLLSDDADFTFNTTGNVLSVTNGQFNTDNIRIDGNTISSTDTNGNVVVSPNGTGAFNLTTETQNWLGSQMVIKDVLARTIITATGVLLTISELNLLIEESIQVDGPIEVMDTVDLNKVTGDQLRVLPDNTTLVGACTSIAINSTLTFDTASDSYQLVKASGEFKFTTGPTFGIPPTFFQFIPTIRCTTNNMTLSGLAVFYNQASIISDGITLTFSNTFPAFLDSPQFSIANGGTYAAAFNYACFRSECVVNTSVAMAQRSGWRFANATGAGTIATQIGFFCAALTKGGTANNPLLINAPDTANASGSMIDGNITFFATAGSYGGGSRVLFMANATTAPSSNPTGGGVLYVTGGALTYRGSGGTVTTVAAA